MIYAREVQLWLKEIDAPTINIGISFPLSIDVNMFDIWKYIESKRKRHMIFLDKLYEEGIESSALWSKIVALRPSRSSQFIKYRKD